MPGMAVPHSHGRVPAQFFVSGSDSFPILAKASAYCAAMRFREKYSDCAKRLRALNDSRSASSFNTRTRPGPVNSMSSPVIARSLPRLTKHGVGTVCASNHEQDIHAAVQNIMNASITRENFEAIRADLMGSQQLRQLSVALSRSSPSRNSPRDPASGKPT